MPPGAVTLKELFQAAQHDDFRTVQEHLASVLHGEDHGGAAATTTTSSSSSSREDQRAAIAALLEPKTKNTLLHYACDNGNLDACKQLLMLEGMAELALNEPNAFGHTPLFYAASSGKLPLVKWLVSNGADIDTDYSDRADVAPREGDHGVFTPLQIACFKGYEDVATFLVECNAELSGTRRNGRTPLHFACAQRHRGVVKLLLDAGADAHACDADGQTPVDVSDAAMLATLLPEEHSGGDAASDDGLDAGADDEDSGDDDDDDGTEELQERKRALAAVASAFGRDISRGFRSKDWRRRASAVSDAGLRFQSGAAAPPKSVLKLFDGACWMIALGVQDAVAQVASSCCGALLKAAFGAAMGEREFHTAQFHRERPVLRTVARALLTRGAGASDKDASEAVASLLFLICKSAELTRELAAQIRELLLASSPADAAAVTWRLQLVSLKILTAIASQYRLDASTSGLAFGDALQISLAALEHSSVHVRAAAVDLLVQCLLIRCEQSEMRGSADELFEHVKSWTEVLFRQQSQPLKPAIHAKINSGLREAIQGSKRLSAAAESSGGPKVPAGLGDLTLSPRGRSALKEDDLPYAEPLQEQHRADAAELLAGFGDKVARCLFSSAWAPRVEALSFLQAQVAARQLARDGRVPHALLPALQRALLQALQDRVNAVYEAGVALLMEVALAFSGAAALQELVRPLVPRLLAKLGDSKSRLHVAAEDALLLLARQADAVGAAFVLEELVACDRGAAPQTLSGVYLANKLALVSKLLLEFGVLESATGAAGALPLRSVLQPALQASEHKDPAVRLASLQIVADALRVARAAAMPFLDALARSSRQKLIAKLVERGVLESDLLMDEVDDFEVEAPPRPGTSNGGVRPPTASGSSTKHRPALSSASLASAGGGGGALAQCQLPYGAALSSEQKAQHAALLDALGEELVRCLLDKTWAQREAAVRELERRVVSTVSGKAPADAALPKSIDTLRVLATALELGLNDTVARVFQCSLRLFQVVVTDFVPLVASTHEYVDAVLETVVGLVMQRLGDSKQRLRADCFALLHALAALNHIGHARVCKMLVDKFQQLARSSAALASSQLLGGELLKLLTLLIKEAHAAGATASSSACSPPGVAQRPDLAAILELLRPAFENKHVDVRNAAIATYAAIYEVTSGGADDAAIDLNGFLAQTKPAIREAITRSVVQITKTLPSAGSDETGDASAPEIDSARHQALALDLGRLTLVCGAPIVALLTSVSPAARCQGVEKLLESFTDAPRGPHLKGAWEISCLLAKQLLLDGTPAVCLAAFELLELLADPPGGSVVGAEYAIPWGEWGVHLILGSTIRSVVQQTASESVRVRERVKLLLLAVATKNAAGKSAVCNALLSAPEQTDLTNEPSKRAKKIAGVKLKWQLAARLELLHDLLTHSSSTGDSTQAASAARRKSTSGSSRQSGETLGVENIVPFLGSCASHPSATIRVASLKLVGLLKETRPEEFARFIQDSCSAALQRRLHALLDAAEDNNASTADHFNADDATCVRGSRSSHVRRIAALRPPRSVPVEESKMAVDVFPPPHSAPGKSRRAGDDGEDDSMNDGSYLVLQREDRREESRSKQQAAAAQQQQQVPIWLEQQASRKGSALFGDGEPESAIGGGAAGLMKMRRKSSYRSNNGGDGGDGGDERRAGAARYSSVQGY